MDPRAKYLRQAKRRLRALNLVRQGCQINQWVISKLEEDTELYLIGKPELVVSAKGLFDEIARQEARTASPTGSLELGSSSSNDSEAPHVGEVLQEEGISKDKVKSKPEGPFDFARDVKKA